VARYYFHLVSPHEVILDDEGVEVTDLAEARAEALKTIDELRRESPSAAEGWEGWRLDVADAAGSVVFSISLDERFH
jgi:hypothetical protein